MTTTQRHPSGLRYQRLSPQDYVIKEYPLRITLSKTIPSGLSHLGLFQKIKSYLWLSTGLSTIITELSCKKLTFNLIHTEFKIRDWYEYLQVFWSATCLVTGTCYKGPFLVKQCKTSSENYTLYTDVECGIVWDLILKKIFWRQWSFRTHWDKP